MNRRWTEMEDAFLEENWGNISIKGLASRLNRTPVAIQVRAVRKNLGPWTSSMEHITTNQLCQYIGWNIGGTWMSQLIEEYDFPAQKKLINKRRVRVTRISDFWKWAYKNQSMIDWSRLEENVLGIEPAWVKECRKADTVKNKICLMRKWEPAEDAKLIRLAKRQQYTYSEMPEMLNRTSGAIQQRLRYLGVKDRPLKAGNNVMWSPEDVRKLGELIKHGYRYPAIARELGKSDKAVRGKVYLTYLTESCDKVRKMMGTGEFGTGRPDKRLRHVNCMNVKERNESLAAAGALTTVLFLISAKKEAESNG